MSDAREPALAPLEKAARVIQALKTRLDAAESRREAPIALVGMGCRFPGGADDPERFWRLLEDGVDAIGEVPAERQAETPWDDPSRPLEGTAHRRGGFIGAVDRFDAAFFGLTPREAASMDPQHRLLLEESWHALEDAGIDPFSLRGSDTGVFVGIASNDYGQMLLRRQDYGAYYLTGNPLNAAAGRLAFTYGLNGPCAAIDTACSASLVAVHQACQALRLGDCSLAFAAGVNLVLLPLGGFILARAGMLAADGLCKPLDAAADGYVRSEGCGVVVLKRLADALRDGNRVHAVLLGSAVNHGGASAGFIVPNGAAQQQVIRRAVARAGIEAADIGYVEMHGTGTPLGDPIEVRALAAALGDGRAADRAVMIGSVKSNIGHLEAAAGIAGLIKTVLAVSRGRVPASLHVREPNPDIPWAELPVAIARESSGWRPGRRLAGVSSFGASGTNAHVIVAAPEPVSADERPVGRQGELLLISARSRDALAELARQHAARLADLPPPSFAAYAASCATRRAHLPHRLALLAADPASAALRLGAGLDDPKTIVGEARGRAKLVLVVPPSPVALPWEFPAFAAASRECGEQLGDPAIGEALKAGRLAPELAGHLAGYALGRMWLGFGLQPAAIAGIGAGLRAAAALAGAIGLGEALASNDDPVLTMSRIPLHDGSGRILGAGAVRHETVALAAPDLVAACGGGIGLELGMDADWPAIAVRLARLHVASVAIDWRTVYPPLQAVPLPAYPFARDRHWLPPELERPAPSVPVALAAEMPAGPAATDLAGLIERQLGEVAGALTRIVEQQLAALPTLTQGSLANLAPVRPAPARAVPAMPAAPAPGADLVLAAADDVAGLQRNLATLGEMLRQTAPERWHETALSSRQATTGRHRAMVMANGPAEAAAIISADGDRRLKLAVASEIRVSFVFPGLGEQHPGMGKRLYDKNAWFRRELDRLCDLAAAMVDADLREIMFSATPPRPAKRDFRAMLQRARAAAGPAPDSGANRLSRTLYAHAAIFVIEVALVRLWQHLRIEPAMLAGYSLGEYTAACVAGVMDERTALELIAARARLIEGLPAGGMLAAAAGRKRVEPLLDRDVWIAAMSAPELTVLGGSDAALDQMCARLKENNLVHRRLSAVHAFHTPHMEPIGAAFRERLKHTELRPPRLPYLGNLTGDWVAPAAAIDPEAWVRHAIEPVRFADALERLLAEPEMAVLEVGPGQSLTSFAHQFPRRPGTMRLAVSSLPGANDGEPDEDILLETAGRLWLAGAPVDWARWERSNEQ
jgi:acyl transferase domain-containing protein